MNHEKILAFLDSVIKTNGSMAYLTQQEFDYMKLESYTFERNLKERWLGSRLDVAILGYYKHLELRLDNSNE